jgi:hypothetical protein
LNCNLPEGPRPVILAFFQPYPAQLYPEQVEEPGVTFESLEELQAALFRQPPTQCSTPGKMRPGGFNRNGKYLPAKYIPSKMDKRAGK